MTDYIVGSAPNSKYIRTLLQKLPDGFKIGTVREVPGGGRPTRLVNRRHPCVVAPDGTLLRRGDGRPVTVAGTPGGLRGLQNDLNDILKTWREARAR